MLVIKTINLEDFTSRERCQVNNTRDKIRVKINNSSDISKITASYKKNCRYLKKYQGRLALLND